MKSKFHVENFIKEYEKSKTPKLINSPSSIYDLFLKSGLVKNTLNNDEEKVYFLINLYFILGVLPSIILLFIYGIKCFLVYFTLSIPIILICGIMELIILEFKPNLIILIIINEIFISITIMLSIWSV